MCYSYSENKEGDFLKHSVQSNALLLCCVDPVLMSDTTSMYRTSQQIGNSEHNESLFFF